MSKVSIAARSAVLKPLRNRPCQFYCGQVVLFSTQSKTKLPRKCIYPKLSPAAFFGSPSSSMVPFWRRVSRRCPPLKNETAWEEAVRAVAAGVCTGFGASCQQYPEPHSEMPLCMPSDLRLDVIKLGDIQHILYVRQVLCADGYLESLSSNQDCSRTSHHALPSAAATCTQSRLSFFGQD